MADTDPPQSLISVFWPYLSFFAGLVLGHWLSLGRDRRAEFNEVADRVFDGLKHEFAHSWAVDGSVSANDLDHLIRRVSWFRRKALIKAVDSYRKVRESGIEQDSCGAPMRTNIPDLKEPMERLLKFVERK